VSGAGARWRYYTDAEFSALLPAGLLLLTNRYYAPGTGRFLTRDPVGYAGGINPCRYVGNGPASLADPLGLPGVSHATVFGEGLLGAAPGFAALGPPGAAIGFGLGAGLGRYGLNRDVGAADEGLNDFCVVGTLRELGGEEAAAAGSNTLYHCTTGPGQQGILATQQLNASVGGPKVAYDGSGQYLTNIAPNSGLNICQISYRLYTIPGTTARSVIGWRLMSAASTSSSTLRISFVCRARIPWTSPAESSARE
jgi:RHS repeat-associated protein